MFSSVFIRSRTQTDMRNYGSIIRKIVSVTAKKLIFIYKKRNNIAFLIALNVCISIYLVCFTFVQIPLMHMFLCHIYVIN